ncbi:MAG: potassium-transporting ATPase KdpC subunit [Mycobacterium sp.]|jgi:K+-transporting ATPase ATPase C chain|nr:potassium-transporting ATPase KdpC subunit [Mycobacterium sp.]
MNLANLIRVHWAAIRALLVLTVITGFAYPLFIWLVAQIPGLRDNANGSIIEANGKPVGSSLIGQSFTADDKAIPKYFQSRPSAAGDGYDPLKTSASNLGPEDIVDTLGDPSASDPKDNGSKDSLLTTVCTRSLTVAETEGLGKEAGARPYCTPDGKGQVLSVMGPRDNRGNVTKPWKVVSVNQPCETTPRTRGAEQTPAVFQPIYEGQPVQCAKFADAEEYKTGQIVPIRGNAPANPVVPADAVTASGSGLDPDISVAYAELQVPRVAKARGVTEDKVRQAVRDNESGRTLGFMGEPRVNVLALNVELDQKFPAKS